MFERIRLLAVAIERIARRNEDYPIGASGESAATAQNLELYLIDCIRLPKILYV
jgi:hypothetical protein